MKISFLSLQYNNVKDTMKCLESIKETCGSGCVLQVIIIDNNSHNMVKEDFENRLKEYRNKMNIKVIYSDKNLGFSRGNNLGYCEVKKFDPDFLFVTNNDIIFQNSYLPKVLNKIYEKTEFDLLGPDIYSPENKNHQNPLDFHCPKLEEAVEWKKLLTDELSYYEKGVVPPKNKKTLKMLIKMKAKESLFGGIIKKIQYEIFKKNKEIILCGACIITSRNYIRKSEKMFYPETFMYYEEYLLGLRCKKEMFKVSYDPKLKVIHNNGKSVATISSDMIKRMIFCNQAKLDAIDIYINELKEIE